MLCSHSLATQTEKLLRYCVFAACVAQELGCVAAAQEKSQSKGELPGLTGRDKRLPTELEEEPAFSSLYPLPPSLPSSSSYIGCLSFFCPLQYMHLIACLPGDSLPVAILFHSFTSVNANSKLSSVMSVLRRRNICETKRSKEKKMYGRERKN